MGKSCRPGSSEAPMLRTLVEWVEWEWVDTPPVPQVKTLRHALAEEKASHGVCARYYSLVHPTLTRMKVWALSSSFDTKSTGLCSSSDCRQSSRQPLRLVEAGWPRWPEL